MELDDKIYEQIETLSERGNALMDDGQFDQAATAFREALSLLPSPQSEWEAATWLNASVGDALFMQQDYQTASEYLYDAYSCPDGTANPFICLRLGECLYHLGNEEQAKEYLLRAYMLEGEEMFELESPEYLEFLRTHVNLKGEGDV